MPRLRENAWAYIRNATRETTSRAVQGMLCFQRWTGDDEGHGFMHPHNARRFYAAAEAFLAEHLGGRAEPAQPDEDIEPFLR